MSSYSGGPGGRYSDRLATSPAGNEGENQEGNDVTSPTALRRLVLDYLLHHCYVGTAAAFAKEGDLETTSAGLNGAMASTGNAVASTSAATPSSTSFDKQRAVHPLAAPPLSRQDSTMEVEADTNLLSAGQSVPDSNTVADDDDVAMASGHSISAARADEISELSIADMHTVRLRQQVRDQILAGQIKKATELLNTHFPAVLKGSDDDADQTVGNATPGKSRTRSKSASSRTRPEGLPASPTSLDPQHLALNLQIQAFIESVRMANTPQSHATIPGATQGNGSLTAGSSNGHSNGFAGSTPASPSSHNHHPHHSAQHHYHHSHPASGISAATAASLSRASSPAPSTASSSSTTTSHLSSAAPSALQTALANAQLLYLSVQSLPSGLYKDLYKQELESVTAILAYKDLERSPLKRYLDLKRRRSLADQINSAIMFRLGRPSQPLIESAVRQTTFVWSQLHNEEIAVPLDHPSYDLGARVSGSSSSGVGGSSLRAGTTTTSASLPGSRRGDTLASRWLPEGERKGVKSKVPPPFSLQSFLA